MKKIVNSDDAVYSLERKHQECQEENITNQKNVTDNGMCRVAHACRWGMRPRNGTSVNYGICHWKSATRNNTEIKSLIGDFNLQ
ncbi:hypothetical protein KQX54_000073 [Cotesia glomerata]|uniref:Uncharacterized protein n=1 Tax=Cotesia glomerata TaxID=32391 RepID=A0AAV7ITQ8_COTGL|nr:hypothetical protein KQX54_000073 [Cotesia glomerata]